MKHSQASTVVLFLIVSLLSVGFIQKQEDPIKNLLAKLEQYRELNPHEKVHVHTDKPYYSIGDTIWFKAYVVNSESNRLSALSKIVYVDLINDRDSIKKSLRIPLISGLGWGDFVLSDSLSEGNYRIRAYTTWMRNYDEDYFFDKTIQIGDALSNQVIATVNYAFNKTGIKENVEARINFTDVNGKPLANKEVSYTVQLDYRNIASGKGITDAQGQLMVRFTNNQPFVLKSGAIHATVKLSDTETSRKRIPIKTTSSESDVQFFPEGGHLVRDIRSRVAFKMVGSDGLSRQGSGVIKDKNGRVITEFRTGHAGMGNFMIVPERDNDYTAHITFEDGSQKQILLPKALDTGYVLSINGNNSEEFSIRISASEELLNQGEITLIAQHNGLVNYVSKTRLNKNVIVARLPKKRFPTGIQQFTLFAPSFQPVAERLVFVRHEALNLDISSNKEVYGNREKVNLAFSSTDSAGAPSRGNFSVSVINETLTPFDDVKETTILSNLLLTSDIKGYVEQPNYYFTGDYKNREVALDNLMMTQGWRRFTWKEILNKSYPNTVYRPEQSLSISGRVTSASNKPVIGGKVTVFPVKGGGLILDTLTDQDGRFNFNNLRFNDSTTFVVQARTPKDKKNVVIELDRLSPFIVTKNKNAAEIEVNVNQSLRPYLLSRQEDFAEMRKRGLLRNSIVLAEVTITEKKPAITNSSNLNGAGNADAIIKADRLINCINLTQCLQGLVPGLIVQNGIAYLTRSMYSSFSGLVPMQLIVDGMYVEPDYLSIIPPQDVESIEVLKSAGNTAIYGMRGGGGVLIINTKRGEPNLSYRTMAQGITSYKPQGLYAAREFYSPKYAEPESRPQIPDLRKTIFWTPNLLTDSAGKAVLSFFTADEAGTYKVVAEGLNFEGDLVRKVFRFSVK